MPQRGVHHGVDAATLAFSLRFGQNPAFHAIELAWRTVCRRAGEPLLDTTHTLDVPASTDGVRLAEEALDDFSTAHGLTRNDTWPFHVALEEVLWSIVQFEDAGDHAGRVQVELLLEGEALEMTFVFETEAFNPLEAGRADEGPGAGEAESGGLGIEIVRRLMDTIDFNRVDRLNRLVLRRRLGL